MNRKTSFELHIRLMFRDIPDVLHMEELRNLDLDSYEVVKTQARPILARLKLDENDQFLMPPKNFGGPWPREWIDLFERWIEEEFPE